MHSATGHAPGIIRLRNNYIVRLVDYKVLCCEMIVVVVVAAAVVVVFVLVVVMIVL